MDNHGSKDNIQRPVSDKFSENWDKIDWDDGKEDDIVLSPKQAMIINGFV